MGQGEVELLQFLERPGGLDPLEGTPERLHFRGEFPFADRDRTQGLQPVAGDDEEKRLPLPDESTRAAAPLAKHVPADLLEGQRPGVLEAGVGRVRPLELPEEPVLFHGETIEGRLQCGALRGVALTEEVPRQGVESRADVGLQRNGGGVDAPADHAARPLQEIQHGPSTGALRGVQGGAAITSRRAPFR